MTRAYDYIYTIFGLEVSHTSLSEQALPVKLAWAQWTDPGSGLANVDHCCQVVGVMMRVIWNHPGSWDAYMHHVPMGN
jgi:hypothetical protein